MAIEKCQTMFSFAQPRSRDNIRIQRKLLSKMHLFQNHPELLNKEKYTITSAVDPEVVDIFFARVGGDTDAVVTSENAEQLRALCDELGFSGFDAELKAILGVGNTKTQREFAGLVSRVDRHEVLLERVQRQVAELSRCCAASRAFEARVGEIEKSLQEGGHPFVRFWTMSLV